MRHLRLLGVLFSQHALGYWRMLYALLLVAWSVSIGWSFASGASLETPDSSATLIKVGLLEAVAFLTAWSLLLITITTKIVSQGKEMEMATNEGIRQIEELKEANMTFEQEVEQTLEGIKGEVADMNKIVMEAEREIEQLAEENERLRRQSTDKELDRDD